MLTLTAPAFRALVAHARARAPREAVGLLLGPSRDRVDEVRPLANRSATPTRAFVIDDGEHLQARRDARRAGRVVVGVFHSHPDGPAALSRADEAALVVDGHALFPDEVALVVGLGGAVDARAYAFDTPRHGPARARAAEIRVDGDPDPAC